MVALVFRIGATSSAGWTQRIEQPYVFGEVRVVTLALLTPLFALKGNPKNEIASFRALRSQILAISNPTLAAKTSLDQPLRRCSQATRYMFHVDMNRFAAGLSQFYPSRRSARGAITCAGWL
jgi:hypothetical protein